MAEEEKEKNIKDIFPEVSETNPARDVELPEEEEHQSSGNGHRTYAQAEEESPTDSDLKATLKRLFPKYADYYINQVAQAVMVARIFPDTILDRIYLTVTSVLENQEVRIEQQIANKEEEPEVMDVQMTIDLVTTAYEIGLDAKGRIDAIELAGSAKEAEELESLSRSMGGTFG